MTEQKKQTGRFIRRLIRAMGMFLTILVGILIYLGTFGVPEWLATDLLQWIQIEDVAIESGSVRLHPFKGVVVRDAKVYRKGVVGPPAIEAAELVASVDFLAPLQDAPPLRKITVRDGVIRLAMLHPPGPDESPAPPEETTQFPEARFQMEIMGCDIRGVRVETLQCDVILRTRSIEAKDIIAVISGDGRKGDIRTASVLYDAVTQELSGEMETLLDPHILLSLLDEFQMTGAADLIRDFDFGGGAPRCEVKFRKQAAPRKVFSSEARFWFQNGTYEGVDLLRADGSVHIDFSPTNGIVSVRPLFLVRREGTASGGLTLDLDRSTVDFEAASTLSPQALTKMIGIFTNGVLDDFAFRGQASITGQGHVNWTNASSNRIDLNVQGRDLGWKALRMDSYSFGIRVDGITNSLKDIRGSCYGGETTGRAMFVIDPVYEGDTTFWASGVVVHANFDQFAKSLSPDDKQEYEGKMTLYANVEGTLGEENMDTIHGEGSIRIKDGKIFLLPLFGGLTEMLVGYIPGANFVVNQSDAKSHFVIADKKLHTDNVYIEGNVIRLSGYGDYHFDNTVDFRVQIKFMREGSLIGKLINIPLWFFSKLFEFRMEGTAQDPKWTAFSSTLDLLENLGLKKENKNKEEKPAEDKKQAPSKTEGKTGETAVPAVPPSAPAEAGDGNGYVEE